MNLFLETLALLSHFKHTCMQQISVNCLLLYQNVIRKKLKLFKRVKLVKTGAKIVWKRLWTSVKRDLLRALATIKRIVTPFPKSSTYHVQADGEIWLNVYGVHSKCLEPFSMNFVCCTEVNFVFQLNLAVFIQHCGDRMLDNVWHITVDDWSMLK
jgi:hypothetical protein